MNFDRRLASAEHYAYDVIEMCVSTAPAVPPMRLPIPNPNPKTHPNPNHIFNPNPNHKNKRK